MIPRHAVLAARIRQELQQLEQVVRRVEHAWNSASDPAERPFHLDSIALNLHGFYSGIERVFQLIATSLDGGLPSGADWHRQLLLQMTLDVTPARPAVIQMETAKALDEFLRFRHVVRSLYAYELDPDRLGALVRKLPDTFERVRQDLLAFASFLNELANVGE